MCNAECCCDEEGNLSCGGLCQGQCCIGEQTCCRCDEPCCGLRHCFTYSNLVACFRSFFLFLHTLLIATSIFGLIWANVYFDDFDRVLTGTFVGGHLATLSAGGLLFGLSGLYAAIKRHRSLLYMHSVVTWSAVLLRGFTWLLAMLHEYRLEPFMYAVAPLELLLAFLSSMLLRDACIYY